MTRLLRQSPASGTAADYAGADLPGGSTPWRQARYCVVDLELSGLDPRVDEIISFAAVPVESGVILAGGAVYGVCRPTHPLREASVLVHGIRTIDLEAAAPLDEAVLPLVVAMTGRILVAHAAWVEQSFLSSVLRRQGVRLRHPVIDTQQLGRLLARQSGRHAVRPSLHELAETLGLPSHRPHHALGDALTTAQVFLALAAHLDTSVPETVRSLALAKERARMIDNG